MKLAGQRVAVYARYSTDKQNATSIEDQLRVCREYVERLGGQVAEDRVFLDAGISGTSSARPGLQALQLALKERLLDVVVTEDLSRIGRNQINNLLFVEGVETVGARLLTVNDGYDSSQRQSQFFGTFKNFMAEEYVSEIKARTKRGMDGLFDAGMHTGGRTYGYRSEAIDGTDKRRLVIDDEEAATVRRIFDEWIAGRSLRVIAEGLNADAVPSPRGGKWAHLSVRSLLGNEVYRGVFVFNRREWKRDRVTGKRSYIERPRHEWRRAERPDLAIIDADTWLAAADRRKTTARKYKAGERTPRGYPLSGLLRCSLCGGAMVVTAGGRYYACGAAKKGHGCTNNRSLREPAIRGVVLDNIRDTLGAPELIDDMRAKFAAGAGEHDRTVRAELKQRRADLTRTEQHLSKLLDMRLDGDSPALREKQREKEDYAELQRATIVRLESALGQVPQLPDPESMRAFLRGLPEVARTMPEEAREILGRCTGGTIECEPPARAGEPYTIRFEVRPEVLIAAHTPRVLGVYAGGGCGGAILPQSYARALEVKCPNTYGKS